MLGRRRAYHFAWHVLGLAFGAGAALTGRARGGASGGRNGFNAVVGAPDRSHSAAGIDAASTLVPRRKWRKRTRGSTLATVTLAIVFARRRHRAASTARQQFCHLSNERGHRELRDSHQSTYETARGSNATKHCESGNRSATSSYEARCNNYRASDESQATHDHPTGYRSRGHNHRCSDCHNEPSYARISPRRCFGVAA